MLSRIVNRLTTIVKHPQFQKMKNYYTCGLPFAVMIGGMSGTMIGISCMDKYMDKNMDKYMDKNENQSVMVKPKFHPLKAFGLIIGSFSLGLIGGIFYPILIPFSGAYFIIQTLKQLKED